MKLIHDDGQTELSSFSQRELRRLINLIPETDPTTMQYGELLSNIERFVVATNLIDTILSADYKNPNLVPRLIESVEPERRCIPEKEETVVSKAAEHPIDTPEEEKFDEPETEEAKYSAADVKKALSEARKNGLKISEFLKAEFSVDSFSAIPEQKYGELMKKLAEV